MAKAKVYIEKSSKADHPDLRDETFGRNPYARENVNVPQGPRTGNAGAHDAKRGNFRAAKAERAPLADEVMAAFGERQIRDYEDHDFPNEGSIDENSHVRKFAKSKR